MSRVCNQCQSWKNRRDYSSNQWRKGDGLSRCSSCVPSHAANYCTVVYRCEQCERSFPDSNQLNMHMQTHRPRDVACPLCHEGRFRSGANAVQHVESGYCTGCRGATNAREQIYKFASSQRAMQPYLADVPRLTYGGYDDTVPDFPYSCHDCSRHFKQLSQLLQHQDNKHGSQPLRLQY
jgi:DNA-directed RNA polymerase subunit RPC12/RpoP